MYRILLNVQTRIKIVFNMCFHIEGTLIFCFLFCLFQIEKWLHFLVHKHIVSFMIALIVAVCIVNLYYCIIIRIFVLVKLQVFLVVATLFQGRKL